MVEPMMDLRDEFSSCLCQLHEALLLWDAFISANETYSESALESAATKAEEHDPDLKAFHPLLSGVWSAGLLHCGNKKASQRWLQAAVEGAPYWEDWLKDFVSAREPAKAYRHPRSADVDRQ